jgi:beta-1,4-mannosyltransferase
MSFGRVGRPRAALRSLTVVLSVDTAENENDNPFIFLLASSLSEIGVKALPFSWRVALLGRYQVLHLHWPERLIRSPHRWKRIAKAAGVLFLALRIALCRQAVVETVHNLDPHEPGGRLEGWVLSILRRLLSAEVYLHDAGGRQGSHRGVVIPHGHYRSAYRMPLVSGNEGGAEVLLFGALRPNKGIEGLVEACRDVSTAGLVRIVGAPSTAAYGDVLVRLVSEIRAVELQPRALRSSELATTVANASLVVLPYDNFYNSGAALLSLSLNTPILVPDVEATRRLEKEVGSLWLRRFSPPLTSRELLAALQWAKRSKASGSAPDLSERGWTAIAESHERLYRSLT